MKITWQDSDSVAIVMDALDYHCILDFIVLLEVAMPRAPKGLPRFREIEKALYDGMEGRTEAKQRERTTVGEGLE